MSGRSRLSLRALLLAAPLCFAMAGVWAPDLRAELSEATRWADPAHVKLGVEFPGEGYHADWELFRCDCGDLLVRSELNVPGDVEAGETLLVGGRAVLSRGFAGDAELGASLDAPALMMQLALRLLERAEPGGPAAVTGEQAIDLVETVSPILLQSYSASGGFQAPWSLRGSIAPVGETRRRFDLHFEFTAGAGSAAQKGTMRLKGIADFAALDFPLAADTKLEGWTLTWRDVEGSEPPPDRPETLDALRILVRDSQP